MSQEKIHNVRLDSIWGVEVESIPSSGRFILIFSGRTEKGKLYHIALKMELYFIRAIASCLLKVRFAMKEFFNEQFEAFKDE